MKVKKYIVMFIICFITIFSLIAYTKEPANGLKRIEESGILTAAGSGGYPPFNYIKDGKVVGFDVDVAEEIAKRMGVKLKYVVYDRDKLIEQLRNKKFDAIIAGMAITDERLKFVDFTDPYYYSGSQLFVLKDSGIYSASQMEGKPVGVGIGTTFEGDAEKLGAVLKYYKDDEAAMNGLVDKEVEGVVTGRFVGLTAMEEFEEGDEIAIVGRLLRFESSGIAINKEDTKLKNRMNEIIKEMREDGTLKEISEKWFNKVDITVK